MSSLPHSCDRVAASLRRSEIAVAERDRRRVVLGDVMKERLAQPSRDREQLADRLAGRVVVAEHHEGRREPGERLALELDVVELPSDVARLEQHPVDVLVRRAAPRPVRRRERRAEGARVAATPGHRDRLVAREHRATRLAAEVERARQPAEHAGAKLRVVLLERGIRLL